LVQTGEKVSKKMTIAGSEGIYSLSDILVVYDLALEGKHFCFGTYNTEENRKLDLFKAGPKDKANNKYLTEKLFLILSMCVLKVILDNKTI
jgi:hypothetical protein